MSRKYKFHEEEGLYLTTFATVGWIDVLTRREDKDIVVESLRYCQQYKGLRLFEGVIMSNHVHLLAAPAQGGELSAIMRDMKKYTSGRIHRAIVDHDGESRKEWMLKLLEAAGRANSSNDGFQLWQQNNQPLLLESAGSIDRAVHYVRLNPVKEGLVEEEHEYVYSSAHEPGPHSLKEL